MLSFSFPAARNVTPPRHARRRARPAARWQCRGSERARVGRGRAAKRTALYDAMDAYTGAFAPLLAAELAAEQAEAVARRDPALSRAARVACGIALYDLCAEKQRRVFSNAVYALAFVDGRALPQGHRFVQGDLVEVCAVDGAGEPVEATVLERMPRRLLVAVPIGSEAAAMLDTYEQAREFLQIEQGANATANARAVAALQVLTTPSPATSFIARFIVTTFEDALKRDTRRDADSDAGEPSRSYAGTGRSARSHGASPIGLVRGIMKASSDDGAPSKWEDMARESVPGISQSTVNDAVRALPDKMNASQRHAIKAALRRRVSLIQGPPGTGKTWVTAYFIAAAVQMGAGPVLATAASNVAADTLLEKVIGAVPRTTRVVRIGRVAAIDPQLWGNTLDAILEQDPAVKQAREVQSQGGGRTSDVWEAEMLATHRIIRNAHVVVGTCVGSGREILQRFRFPLVVVDEATQATEPDILIPLALASGQGAEQLVLVGDHHQLPPTVLSEVPTGGYDAGLRRSIFLRLWLAGVQCQLLDMQYRMHPNIAQFPSLRFYFGRLKSAVKNHERALPAGFCKGGIVSFPETQVAFVDVADGTERRDSDILEMKGYGHSYANPVEATAVLDVMRVLLGSGAPASTLSNDSASYYFSAKDIGIISPYAAQVRLIGRLVAASGERSHDVEVSTVDGFQGREKNVIVISTVRCNAEQTIGFLRDWRRLNVAITRPRYLLVVVGSGETLAKDPNWGAWVHWARKSGSIMDRTAFQPLHTE